jgi:hypothetical protein
MVKNYNREIWEGWTVQDYINELEPAASVIMENRGVYKPFRNKEELARWCSDNQSFYKKPIPEVVEYFANRYNIT